MLTVLIWDFIGLWSFQIGIRCSDFGHGIWDLSFRDLRFRVRFEICPSLLVDVHECLVCSGNECE